MKERIGHIVYAGFAVAIAALCILSLFLPFPQDIGHVSDVYRCVWEDGSVTEEPYSSLYGAVTGAGEEVLLERNEKHGVIAGSERYERIYTTLCSGTLAELLALQTEGLTRPESLALWRTFSDCIWYSEGCFIWDGGKIKAEERQTAQSVVLLSGELKRGYLASSGAVLFTICPSAQVSAEEFIGSSVENLVAQPPYCVSGEALYLQTTGGKRLIAALPGIISLTVDEDTQFIDEGALAPCKQINTLNISFAGNAKDHLSSSFSPYIGALFGEDEEGKFAVPSTLESVCVTGGRVYSHAFYGCTSVKEIDLRGVDYIERDALTDCVSLRRVYTSEKITLAGFTEYYDGVEYIYERQ